VVTTCSEPTPIPTLEKLRQDLAAIRTRTSISVTPTYPTIATVMRVKDEAPYIKRAIKSLLPLGGEIIVLDDGSTDGTTEIINSFSGVRYHRQDDLPMDEGRDRTFLLHEALKYEPDWIFTLDGDEELSPRACDAMLSAARNAPDDVTVLRLQFAVMWGVNQYFVQSKFIWPQDRMFRVAALEDKGYQFYSMFHRNLHCGCVPKHGVKPYNMVSIDAFIKYWGYDSKEACEKKLDFYIQNDPDNFGNTLSLVSRRNAAPKGTWRDDLSCREIGIAGTVSFLTGGSEDARDSS
jgi:glycosyltransferase involved in cell wall biosynthesis